MISSGEGHGARNQDAVVTTSNQSATATPARPHRPARPKLSRYLVAVGLVVVLAGLLFGYDQGVISGALDGIDKTFHPSTVVTEIITSWVTLGAMVGALVAGELAERLGRRVTILLAAVIFVVGALLEALAPDIAVLVLGRLVLGAGVGIASVAAPLYGAENAPARVRGRFVSLYQMAITIGIFFAYFADYLLLDHGADSWRFMLGISAVPAVLLLVAVWPLGDSARWYLRVGRRKEAESVIRRANPAADVEAESAAIRVSITTEDQATWGEVFKKEWRRPLVVASVLAVLQQLTGINAIIYYADTIFAAAGFNDPTSQSLATLWAVGGVNVVATLIAVFWVDRFGRKPLLLIGTSGMLFGLLTVAGAFFELNSVTASQAAHHGSSQAATLALVGLVVFIASFAFSLGPVVWTVINEVFPARVRGRGVAVATAINWLAAWVVAQTFLSLVGAITTEGTFLLFAGFCVVTFVYVRWFVPETKGKTLEEVQEMWSDPEGLERAISTWD
jgi:SP family galactose:H+ symporter-like MFS transporter